MPETETVTGSADFSGVRTYVYDDAGNLTSKITSGDYGAKSESYVYDAFGKLIKYLENGEEKASYKYNGNGQRVEKTVNGAKTKYYWDGANIKNEGTANAVNATNYFGANGVFARKSGSVTNTLYKNGHGDTVLLTSGNTVVRDYEYDAYGKEKGGSSADLNPFRYSGEYFDSETGFIYLRNRYYDPSSARFISEDTHWNVENCIYGDSETGNRPTTPNIGAIIQSSNLSAYCMGNPVMYVDKDGESVVLTCVILGAVIGAVIGGGIGAKISMDKYGEVSWKYVAGGMVLGGVAGGLVGWGAGAIITKLGIIETARNIMAGGGASLESFSKLKSFLGSPGEGKQWHHIVEQCQTKSSRAGFPVSWVQNSNNVINISKDIHKKISAYYSSIQDFTDGMTVRDWLSSKSFEEQYEFGIKILKKYGAI